MNRFLTFRFDDGFIKGARRAARLLHPDPATFFIVTGQLGGLELTRRVVQETTLSDTDFGTLEDWRRLVEAGHDVQTHSVTHPYFSRLSPAEQLEEIRGSLGIVRQLHGGPYAFCFPYNDIVPVDLASEGLSAAGFRSRSSGDAPLVNRLNAVDLFSLQSWMVRERHFDRVVADLRDGIAPETWTILGFHSLDGEGHEPWSSSCFSRLVEAGRAFGYTIVSVAQMLARLSDSCRER